MISEHVMQQGSFLIRMRDDAPRHLLEQLIEFGHVVVTSQHLNPLLIGDASMLTAARYTGVLLATVLDDPVMLEGAGLVWHLGDADGVGPHIENTISLNGVALSAAIAAVLPDAISAGTISDTGLAAYTGIHEWELPLDALRTITRTLGADFRILPDFTLDANASEVDGAYNIITPKVVAVRHGWGTDHRYTSLPADSVNTRRDAWDYVNRIAVIEDQLADGAITGRMQLVDGLDRTDTYFDGLGNPLQRTRLQYRPGSEALGLADYLTSELALTVIRDTQEITLDDHEIAYLDGTDYQVGDAIYVFDPPSGFVDTSQEIQFRGEPIWPATVRILHQSWPLVDGMGVYYRPSAATVAAADWIDLTRWVEWETP